MGIKINLKEDTSLKAMKKIRDNMIKNLKEMKENYIKYKEMRNDCTFFKPRRKIVKGSIKMIEGGLNPYMFSLFIQKIRLLLKKINKLLKEEKNMREILQIKSHHQESIEILDNLKSWKKGLEEDIQKLIKFKEMKEIKKEDTFNYNYQEIYEGVA